MYAIAEIAGKQFKLQADRKVYIPLTAYDVDDTFTVDRILLVSSDAGVSVGAPTVAGATATLKVLRHVKADKVLVFKKKRRKRYKVMRGHRQQYTQVLVSSLDVS